MQRKIITTADGSKTIQIEEWNEQYHSIHGAIQEANHVYIKHGLLFCFDILAGLRPVLKSEDSLNENSRNLSVLEIGFGTGLNCFLTLLEAEKHTVDIQYCGVEAFPISAEEMEALNYVEELQVNERKHVFDQLHLSAWEHDVPLTPHFKLQKQQKLFKDITAKNQFDLIYFDAFGARVQPELWTESIFRIMFDALKTKGVLVTYAAKGSVRRAMQDVGFSVEKLPGPPGKREMLRATKGDDLPF
ncbi:tRNA (5-methylaminomethyl-2-thiouridine)(34)-methyltransferase MnmD [Gelidibacter salicanalis]|uniref:tRNA (5-methylaminomethyl-2-thiouridine)(34)-methyltransferase MnmD n=1 Tax=Gelidibacter salicanalis TaxID=291193 RepID=A0A934KLF5_9FLAO|nr:tRNA (5-methylaminomethyl-2-thiouridine)(34)-methyltransferase MnmD [Gelidibacter salicanalis]MBJ7879384.1 tRNA (5-methylaminomethyl-2-thiouridine)(34)-methyltransferase MnmD [Gelidibacter salicanalis]